jgi:lipoyl(octanoyl) transferase
LRKRASIGIHVTQRVITSHGFALNVTPQVHPYFTRFTPCGLAGVKMTSLQDENPKLKDNHLINVEQVADTVIDKWKSIFDQHEILSQDEALEILEPYLMACGLS